MCEAATRDVVESRDPSWSEAEMSVRLAVIPTGHSRRVERGFGRWRSTLRRPLLTALKLEEGAGERQDCVAMNSGPEIPYWDGIGGDCPLPPGVNRPV